MVRFPLILIHVVSHNFSNLPQDTLLRNKTRVLRPGRRWPGWGQEPRCQSRAWKRAKNTSSESRQKTSTEPENRWKLTNPLRLRIHSVKLHLNIFSWTQSVMKLDFKPILYSGMLQWDLFCTQTLLMLPRTLIYLNMTKDLVNLHGISPILMEEIQSQVC